MITSEEKNKFMITPKEKANELIKTYRPIVRISTLGSSTPAAIEAALITVNNIIESSPLLPSNIEDWHSERFKNANAYWNEVKTELLSRNSIIKKK